MPVGSANSLFVHRAIVERDGAIINSSMPCRVSPVESEFSAYPALHTSVVEPMMGYSVRVGPRENIVPYDMVKSVFYRSGTKLWRNEAPYIVKNVRFATTHQIVFIVQDSWTTTAALLSIFLKNIDNPVYIKTVDNPLVLVV